MGRDKIELDEALLEDLASILCTMEEIASIMKCNKKTLERRFMEPIERGRSRGKESLRRAQWKLALGGNATMCIWLGKQYLDQRDTIPTPEPVVDQTKKVYATEWGSANESASPKSNLEAL